MSLKTINSDNKKQTEYFCPECGSKLVFQHSEEFMSNGDYETFTGTWETVNLHTCVNSDCDECGELYSTEESVLNDHVKNCQSDLVKIYR